MKRTLKRELNSTWNCWEGRDWKLRVRPGLCTPHGLLYVLGAGQHRFVGRYKSNGWYVVNAGSRIEASSVPFGSFGNCTLRMLAEGFQSTRLETRTKESNMYASWWVINPWSASNLTGGRACACTIDRPWSSVKGLSTSIPVGTRKMVNYAWAGRSQRKLWWRLVDVLTCKSLFGLGYRGERLIELSSSWFPPKFPPG